MSYVFRFHSFHTILQPTDFAVYHIRAQGHIGSRRFACILHVGSAEIVHRSRGHSECAAKHFVHASIGTIMIQNLTPENIFNDTVRDSCSVTLAKAIFTSVQQECLQSMELFTLPRRRTLEILPLFMYLDGI